MNTTVRFTDFWKSSNSTQENFFIPLVELIYEEDVTVVQDPSIKVDLEFFSVFNKNTPIQKRISSRFQKKVAGKSQQSESYTVRNARKSIWFTGENKRPPLSQGFDSYLGFEPDGFIKNVHYLPLWVLNLDNFGRGSAHGFTSAKTSQEILTSPRESKTFNEGETKFCCAFISNPLSFRLGLIKELNEIETVDIFGKVVNRTIHDKVSVAQNYRFGIAFENNIYPGYVTEKLMEAYTSGTIPVYWGNDSESYFNPKSFINLYDFKSFQEFKLELQAINSDPTKYQRMFCQPLLNRPFDLESLMLRIRSDLF